MKGRSREELVELCRVAREKSMETYYRAPSICRQCNKVILVREGRPACEARNKKFCSRSCSASFNNKRRVLPDNFNKHLRKIVDCVCSECGVTFTKRPSMVKVRNNFCSKKCASKFRKKVRGSVHPSWKGTTSAANAFYMSPEWKELRTKVFIRDNYVCKNCGKRGNKLEANHIKPRSRFPDLKLVESNVETLCVACHKEVTRLQRSTKQI